MKVFSLRKASRSHVMAATSASLLHFGRLDRKKLCFVLAMVARFKLLKYLLFLLLLVGDIGPQPASLEAHLPRAPSIEDQANILFFSHLFLSVGLMALSLFASCCGCSGVHIHFWTHLRYV